VSEVDKWQHQPKLKQPQQQRIPLKVGYNGAPPSTAPTPNTPPALALRCAEDPEAYQRHIQQFLNEYAPATATETQLVHEIANTAWRLNRIPFLETELLSQDPHPPTLIPQLATLGLHGSRLSRQFQKALDHLRSLHEERRQLTEAAEILLRQQHKGLSWEPADHGFVFSKASEPSLLRRT
jgi:hypothetical protein